MSYYPLFLDLDAKPVVVVGAGKVGLRKTKGLLEAGARVRVVSPACAAGFEALPVKLIRRAFRPSDLKGACLAYAATNVREVNQRVAREAKRRGIPVNVADDPAECDFLVPARIRSGQLQVAISTGGRSPRLAAEARRRMEAVLKATPGKVYLVGAGPGYPELLTLKAAELLSISDVIVYDRLIQEEVLALAKPSAERIYMGKPPGRHASRQDEIHQLLLRKSAEGKIVVRLKGGDPFIFGRGGEEAEFLAAHGIPFEVVPGVSSALAAPLSAGIPVTHRGAASAVAIATGHEAVKDDSRLDWTALSKLDTLVFLMAVGNVSRISQRLIEHGRGPDTPAAMIQMAYWPDEKVVTGTLETIAALVEQAGIQPPATLVVGEVVRLHEKLKHSGGDLRRRPYRPPTAAGASNG